MRMVQSITEEDGQLLMVAYHVPDDWAPSPDWPVVASSIMPATEANLAAGIGFMDIGVLREEDAVDFDDGDRRQLDELVRSNLGRLEHLAAEGLSVQGRELLVRDVYLEHILLAVGGEDAVLACQVDIETRIAEQLAVAEAQLPAARRARAAQVLGIAGGRR